ncbi:initiation factor, subunit 2 family protein [Dictyocaulus viviparus]|uniref:Initiation factor, subunit 2 family protein n=1 Tax=Dictyocaulus viviparus TaxID=29172 RepID=A0A0D8XJE7_DICVI|nr:initiation factor, subunit 2 family protein [Dictyocaulus viviparus]
MERVVNGPIPADFMSNFDNRIKSFRFDVGKNELLVLDQLLLPHKIEYIPIKNTKDAFTVIRKMQVRGAPLIAIIGALSLLVELTELNFTRNDDLILFIEEKVKYLLSSRPTAINLQNALDTVLVASHVDGDASSKKNVLDSILKLLHDESEENRRLIWNGYQEILNIKNPSSKFVLMTICNTGSLATSSWGTALGVIFSLHQANHVEMVFVLETRPYNQVRCILTYFSLLCSMSVFL